MLLSFSLGIDGLTVSALRRAVAEVKQHWWVIDQKFIALKSTKKEDCFGRHVKPLVPAAFAVVSTHQSALIIWYQDRGPGY
jgi:hypothetical protein